MTALAAQPTTICGDGPVAVARLEELSLWIDDRPILRGITLDIAPGSFAVLLGANGAGKSTLLRLLATLTTPSQGRLILFGRPVQRSGSAALRARLGMIGHQPMLYRDLSALENLLFFGRLYDVPDPAARAAHLLDLVGLADRCDDAVRCFSRGMVQRLAIARAMMHAPELILADEPFAGLDAPSTAMLETLLQQLHAAGKTIVLVNHDISQSLRLARRAVVLRQGRVVMDRSTAGLDAAAVLAQVVAGTAVA
jgi:heme exporter protein A